MRKIIVNRKQFLVMGIILFPLQIWGIIINDQVFCRRIHLNTWHAIIYPHSLKVYGQKNNGTPILLGSSPDSTFDNPCDIRIAEDYIEIVYPHIKVNISAKKERLHFCFIVDEPCDIAWPASGNDPQIKAIMYPDGEGLYVPLGEKFWIEQLNDYSCDNLSMPFYGYDMQDETIGYILHTDLRNEIQFLETGNRLSNIIRHNCCVLDQNHNYEISVAFAGKSPLGPALNYKRYLIEQGVYKTLSEKSRKNPEIKKLFGAPHVYVWGDGRTIEFLQYMSNLNIDHLWIGFEQSFTENNVNNTFIDTAIKSGYLVSPYDSFYTMMDPGEADCPNVIFEGMYPEGAIVGFDGCRKIGFAGRGYYISSQALALRDNQPIYDRVEKFIKTGINSYFLDCDAAGELFDDYDPKHIMSQYKDRENRLARMEYLSSNKKMVLGSESAVAWSVPVLAFAHGIFAVNNRVHWQLTADKNHYGGWYPPERPTIFFKRIEASNEYVINKYDPRYRLPLFQAVFHEAIVTTDRWEISHMKFNNIVEIRELLELFYGIPSIWALDLQDVKKYSEKLKKLFSFFSPLHRIIATEPIISFAWLSEDHLIQQINFGDTVQLTANFSDSIFEDLPPKSLQAYWLKTQNKEMYIP
jgi:hypothetical protein